MKNFLELLNNPWIVGIGGGVLSGLLVAWISRMLLSRREDRERQQKIQSANREVIYAIRPGISEGVLPSDDVVDALIVATGRRYGVQPLELYGPAEIAEELTKDVMDSSFLSAKAKNDYCEQLKQLREQALVKAKEVEAQESARASDLTPRSADVTSFALGIVASMMTLLVAVLGMNEKALPSTVNEKLRLLLPGLLVIFGVILAIGASIFQEEIRKRLEGLWKHTPSVDRMSAEKAEGVNKPEEPKAYNTGARTDG